MLQKRYGTAHSKAIAAMQGSTDDYEGYRDGQITIRRKEAGASTPLTMQVMPNPSVGSYEVVFSQQTSGTLILMDMQGREVASRLIKDATHISFKDQPVGVYIANFESDQGEVVTQKVVVVR